MIPAIAPVAALLIGVAILLTGQGLQGTLLPVRATLENFPTLAVGVIGATYFLGFTIGCWQGTGLVKSVGHVRVFAAMTALASASPLLHGMWINLWSWSLLRFISGFCFAVLYVVIESWLNESATNENRGSIFSAYVLINMTMLAVGQQMLMMDDPAVMTLFAMSSVLVSLAAVPVALSTAPTPRQVANVKLDVPYLYRNSPAGMLGSLATGLANGSFWSLAPVFTISYSTDIALTAWFMSAAVIGGAASQWPLGAWSDRVDRRFVMGVCAAAAVLLSITIWLFADSMTPTIVVVLGGLWGAAAFPLYSISIAHSNDHAASDEFVVVSSGLLLMYGVGAVVGPLLAAAFMQILGPAGLYVFTGLIHVVLLIYLFVRRLRRNPAPPEEQHTFTEALTASHTRSQVYEQEVGNG